MTDQQAVELFNRHLPVQPMPDDMQRRIIDRVMPAVRALASGRVDPVTGKIVIVPAVQEKDTSCEHSTD